MGILPVDVIEMLHEDLKSGTRPPDGKLHCSGDLIGSLRHSMLHLVGAPTIESELTNEVVLKTGWFWHDHIADLLKRKGVPVLQEVKLDPWLPEGWSGTADFVFYDPAKEAWVLADLKTTKGEAFRFLYDEGAKDEHIHQVSAYWHALVNAGFTMVNQFAVIYLPKNDVPDRSITVEPYIAEVKPLDGDYLHALMAERWKLAHEYAEHVDSLRPENYSGVLAKNYLRKPENEWMLYINKFLAPPQERVQKMWWNAKQSVFDVKLQPHWSAAYCSFPNELCDCSEQGTTKIGHWRERTESDGEGAATIYEPRKGYEEIEPLVKPTSRELKRRYNA